MITLGRSELVLPKRAHVAEGSSRCRTRGFTVLNYFWSECVTLSPAAAVNRTATAN